MPKIKLLIIVFIVIFAGVIAYILQKQKSDVPSGREEKEKTLIEKQLKELDELRQKSGDQPLSQQQIQKQIEELDKLRLLAQ